MASLLLLLFLLLPAASAVTDPGDLAVLEDLRRGLLNADLLEWPAGDTDPCGSHWPHLVCSGQRVTQIQVQGLGLAGPLPATLGRLTMLTNLGLQRNNLSGGLPSLRGLASLQYAFLGNNHFESIPADFFSGLASLRVLSLDYNPLNHTSGWSLPAALADCPQLVNFSCSECNIVGPLPGELAGLPQLSSLRLAYNSLTGPLPPQLAGSGLQALVLNNQYGDGMSGPIHVLAAMPSLVTVWLHGNSFSGTIPENISACASLAYLVLNNNRLTGTVPAAALRQLPQLQILNLNNNLFLGPVPDLKIQNYSYSWNSFCRDAPGLPCSPVVTALLGFLSGVGYPRQLAESWAGNDPCSSWLGVSCDSSGNVTVLNLPSNSLSGTLSPSLGSIPSLATIMLGGNNLSGTIPASLTKLTSLRLLNLSSNNLQPPIPSFPASVKLLLDSNPYIQNPNLLPPSPSAVNSSNPPSDDGATPPRTPSNSRTPMPNSNPLPVAKSSSITKVVAAVGSVAALLLIALLIILRVRLRKISKSRSVTPGSVVVHPRDSSAFSGNTVKITVAETPSKSIAGSGIQSVGSIATTDTHMFNSGNLLVSVQVLRDVTRNFHPENVVGRGGFGVVYRGELHDGTAIAVKRMEAAVISNKALDEFQSEIAVLSKVRHRNLVSLLGYSIEGSERLLVYEYMPEGALSKHLFHWKELGMEPLSWKRRLNIALDVARGMEYLHNLAHQSFIHRDLKSSNILLDDDFRAKVADFGLVKLAPDGRNSVATRLAGTFGYLAPEYAVTGKITTKADVFSYGVVLMELLTGMAALDEDRPEESRYLASWFFDVKSKREKFKNAIDNSIDLTEETFESICTIAELAGHCAAREPHQRPDMGHAVNVLSPLVEKWKPMKDDQEEFLGIDLHQPLLQMVKGWQADDCSNMTSLSLDDSKGSIPARPTGFAESFTSADGR